MVLICGVWEGVLGGGDVLVCQVGEGRKRNIVLFFWFVDSHGWGIKM